MSVFPEPMVLHAEPIATLQHDAFVRPLPHANPQPKTTAKIRRQARFLEHFALHGILAPAAKHAGVSRQTVWEWEQTDETFAVLKRQAYQDAVEMAEYHLYQRAEEGIETPMTVAGKRELVKKYSDHLLLARVKALRPDRYDRQAGDRPSVHLTQTNNLIVPIEQLSDEQFRIMEQVYGAARPQIIDMKEPAKSLEKMAPVHRAETAEGGPVSSHSEGRE